MVWHYLRVYTPEKVSLQLALFAAHAPLAHGTCIMVYEICWSIKVAYAIFINKYKNQIYSKRDKEMHFYHCTNIEIAVEFNPEERREERGANQEQKGSRWLPLH